MTFLQPPVFDLHTDDSNRNFQYVKTKRVHYETYQPFFVDNLPPKFTKNFIFWIRKLTCRPFSLHLFFHLKTAFTTGSLRNYDTLKQNYLLTPKFFLIDL